MPSRLRRTGEVLRQIGLRPGLLARYCTQRVAISVRRRRLRQIYAVKVAAPRPVELRLPSFDLPPVESLPDGLLDGAIRLQEEADAARDHVFDLLGSGPVSLGDEINWHRDFKGGYIWPCDNYAEIEVTRLNDRSDAKVPWELSRGHQIVCLARAARLFCADGYADEIEDQLNSWLDQNPPGVGINWVNPMEVALRAVNWAFALATIEGHVTLDSSLRFRAAASLGSHGRHIAANLEGTPLLRSNHYLSDILGLLVLGYALDDPDAARWFRYAHRSFERQIVSQVHADGLGFEASTSYHGLALEIFLLARRTATLAKRPFSPRYDARLTLMLEASRAIRHPSGRLPLFGDGDSGRVLPAGSSREPTLDHLLWIGATLMQERAPLPGMPHEEVAWTLGVESWRRACDLPPAPPPSATNFPQGGIYLLRGSGTHLAVRCGNTGQNGNGGHAHNDQMSYELSFAQPVVVDSGTYLYTADPDARNAFRSVRAHNTVMIDGEETNPIDPERLFQLSESCRPRIEDWSEEAEAVRLVASNDAYMRLVQSVLHRRTFNLDRRAGRVSVTDELLGSGLHTVESFVHLAPGTVVTATSTGSFELSNGTDRIRLTFSKHPGLSVELEEGWISDRYGVREHAPVLVARLRCGVPVSIAYTFHPVEPPAREVAGARGERVHA